VLLTVENPAAPASNGVRLVVLDAAPVVPDLPASSADAGIEATRLALPADAPTGK
jgi:hypothetical protein